MALAAKLGRRFKLGLIAALLVVKSGAGCCGALDAPAQRQEAAAQIRYQDCMNGATSAHDESWAAECKRLADQVNEDRSNCLMTLKLPQAYCEASYKDRDASPQCTLPAQVATVLDAALQQAKYRCQRQSEAAQ